MSILWGPSVKVVAEELARLDVDLPAVAIEGELYRRVVRPGDLCERGGAGAGDEELISAWTR